MDLGLKGKVVMVSGASRGIGRAIALGFAAEGCCLSLCARGKDTLDQVALEVQQKNTAALAIAGDVTNEGDAHRWVRETQKHFGKVDILINNAGGSRPRR